MQELLSYAINALIFAAPVYFATMFVLDWNDRHSIATAPIAPGLSTLSDEDEAIAAQLSDLWAAAPEHAIADVVVPFIRPSKSPTVADLPKWSELDPYQLRKACQTHGIKWRNADPVTGKHLKKSAMVAALEMVGAIAS